MAEHENNAYAAGNWHVRAGSEDEFIKRWEEFLTWSREQVPGLHRAHLLRDDQDPRHFLSYSRWQDADAREAWKSHPDFADNFGACRALCDDFSSSDYSLLSNI